MVPAALILFAALLLSYELYSTRRKRSAQPMMTTTVVAPSFEAMVALERLERSCGLEMAPRLRSPVKRLR